MNIVLVILAGILALSCIIGAFFTRKKAVACPAGRQLCGSTCFDSVSKQCVNGSVADLCPAGQQLCGSTCFDTASKRCVNGSVSVLCPAGQQLCDKDCFDPKASFCRNGAVTSLCGSSQCSESQICDSTNTCIEACSDRQPICDRLTVTSSTYCYFIGIKSSFIMYSRQRYYSSDMNYYISMSATDVAIYNASDVIVNILANGLQIPNGSILYFQTDSNVVVYSPKGNVVYSFDTNCNDCSGPVGFEILNGALLIFREGIPQQRIGELDPKGLISYMQFDKTHADTQIPGGCKLNKISDTKFSMVYDYFTIKICYLTWPISDPKILKPIPAGTYQQEGITLSNAWTIFDIQDLPQLRGLFGADKNTGCVAHFTFEPNNLRCDIDLISLNNIRVILNYSDSSVQDCLCYLFLTHNSRKYPYLTEEDLDANLLATGTGLLYPLLVKSYLKFYSKEFTSVNQNERFNIAYSQNSLSSDPVISKDVLQYNINSPAGVRFCNQAPAFCGEIIKDLCHDNPINLIPTTEKGQRDILDGLQTYNIHLESDTCRRFFAQKNADEGSVISRYLQPQCRDYSAKFADTTFRKCCAANNNNNCKLINSLFTENGNCSCFMQSADLNKLYNNIQDAGKLPVGLVDGTCYSDCVLNSQSYDSNTSYNLNRCNSQICIISNTADVNITNSGPSKTTIDQRACCSNLKDTSCK